VWEWQESEFDLLNDSISSDRGWRGGDWNNISDSLYSLTWLRQDPTQELNDTGFRVASVPEPSSLLLVALAGVAMLVRRRR